MKIYDCFTFFNELDLLEIRLSELYDYVDYFVIVEGNKTHSGKAKNFIFKKNKSRYKKWENKIIYVQLKMPTLNWLDKLMIFFEKTRFYKIPRTIDANLGFGRWRLERFQRKGIKKGLKNCKKKDIIMISDLDEIPNKNKITEIVNKVKEGKVISLSQKLYYYYLNGFSNQDWTGTKVCSYETLKKKFNLNPEFVRIPSVL